MMSANGWAAHATAIHQRAPAPCGETTSLPTSLGLMDVSDSYEWIGEVGSDIRLTIEVFWTDLEKPLSRREAQIRRRA